MNVDRNSVAELTSVSELAFELRETLGRGARLIRVESGPPLSQLTVLGHLQRKGAMSTNDLAAAERVRPQSMSLTVQALEKAGLVGRKPHPTDGRATLVQLTRKGTKTLESIFATREDWLTSVIVEQLTDDERQELHRGLALIQRIIHNRE
ncbi:MULTISPECIES: MarR family winged helix-turn-helix transcriptional regulator [Paraburkholderia]|uniref:MarR family winged helix-turn-helix transcriptional regulator n=1 Tax=Paraburkholderia TaxID=1822464 RepID=UPI0005A1832E|nr:MarR family transcriptional regulator [Paraburkholderia phenoliruptrix]